MYAYTNYDQTEQRHNSGSKRQKNSLSNREVQFLGNFPKETEFRLHQLDDILHGHILMKLLLKII